MKNGHDLLKFDKNWNLIKIIFDFKIDIGIFETANVPNFNIFGALSILGPNRW